MLPFSGVRLIGMADRHLPTAGNMPPDRSGAVVNNRRGSQGCAVVRRGHSRPAAAAALRAAGVTPECRAGAASRPREARTVLHSAAAARPLQLLTSLGSGARRKGMATHAETTHDGG